MLRSGFSTLATLITCINYPDFYSPSSSRILLNQPITSVALGSTIWISASLGEGASVGGGAGASVGSGAGAGAWCLDAWFPFHMAQPSFSTSFLRTEPPRERSSPPMEVKAGALFGFCSSQKHICLPCNKKRAGSAKSGELSESVIEQFWPGMCTCKLAKNAQPGTTCYSLAEHAPRLA